MVNVLFTKVKSKLGQFLDKPYVALTAERSCELDDRYCRFRLFVLVPKSQATSEAFQTDRFRYILIYRH